MAKLLKISENAVENYETGYTEPNLETLHKIANVFGVSAAYIAMLTDDPEVKEDSEVKEIYVVNSPRFGNGVISRNDIVGSVYMNRADMHGRDHYALVVNDDSLKKARIEEGDILIVRKQSDAQPGDLVLALLPDGKSIVRRYDRVGQIVILKPENPAFDQIKIDTSEDEFRILGKVVEARVKIE